MGTPTTVGVNDDLTSSKTGVTLGTTDDEKTGRLDLVSVSVQSYYVVFVENLRGRRSCHQASSRG